MVRNGILKNCSLLIFYLSLLVIAAGCQISVDSPSPTSLASPTPEPAKPEQRAFFTPALPSPFKPTPAPTRELTPETRHREIDGSIEVFIPKGTFQMGCDPEHNGGFECFPDETPLHEVFLSDFYIDKYEITNGQYARCVTAGACTMPKINSSATRAEYYGSPTFKDFPFIAVNWFQADAYCRWVGGRLPTEAEWEKAARGTDLQPFPWGDRAASCELAAHNAFYEGQCTEDTVAVGTFPEGASPYGVEDLAGNVWEWTNDWYSPSYYASSPAENPSGPESGEHKIVKGGAWDYSAGVMRVSYNSDHAPQEFKLSFGFRCIRPQ